MSSIVGGFIQGDTARKEGKRIQDSTNAANTIAKEQYEQQRKDAEPWRQAGLSALPNLQNQANFRDFEMADFEQDPGYQFRMDEGLKAVERSASARGGLFSGRTGKELARYGQDFASSEYNNAYNRFSADRDSRYNRLASLAGVGQVANTQVGNASQNFSNAFGQNIVAGANARAAGNMAGVQAMNQGFQQTKQDISNMGGMAAMFCDVVVKKNLSPITHAEIVEFKEHIQPLFFEYVSSDYGDGDFAGPLAQDLEKSKLGRTLVKTNSDGIKVIDPTRAMMLLLALQGRGA